MKWIVFFAVISTPSFAEVTYVGLDGEEHIASPNTSLQEIEGIIKQVRRAMYANSGEVGARDSLAVQAGEEIVSSYLNDLLREMAYYERLSQSSKLERGKDDKEWRDEQRKIRDAIWSTSRSLGTDTNRKHLAARVKGFDEQNTKRAESIQWYMEALGETIPTSGKQLPKLTAAERQRYQLTLKMLREEDEREKFQQGPERELLRAFDRFPSIVAQCHEQLFRALPKALSGYHPPEISPALMAAIKKKMRNDPEYAKSFQEQMLHPPAAPTGRNAKGKDLYVGSAQGLELFLYAGDAHPTQKVEIPGTVKVLSGPFDVNTAPLFKQLSETYGKDVGPEDGLKMVGVSEDPTLHSPNLQRALTRAVRPDGDRRSPMHFQYANCGYESML